MPKVNFLTKLLVVPFSQQFFFFFGLISGGTRSAMRRGYAPQASAKDAMKAMMDEMMGASRDVALDEREANQIKWDDRRNCPHYLSW